MRISSLGLALWLAACAPEGTGAQAGEEDLIECALGGAGAFTRECRLERDAAASIVIRHPDGGFRRFEVLTDGGLREADGAERAEVVRVGERLDIFIGADRYRIGTERLAYVR